MNSYAIGVDFGTNSVRAIVVDCRDGSEVAASVFGYPTGHQGVVLDPRDHNLARQHPADYLAGLEESVTGALRKAAEATGFSADRHFSSALEQFIVFFAPLLVRYRDT